MSKTAQLLEQTFTPEINKKLVDCLSQAYEATSDSYAPENGHDGMVFGLMVYKSAIYFLNELSYFDDTIKVIFRNPRFLMQIGNFTVATYKVGSSFDSDLESAFPNNRIGAYKMAEANLRQMSFDFMEDGTELEDDSSCTNVILAHVGNVEEGLIEVFLGIPTKFNDQRQITGWGTVFKIWSKGSDDFGVSGFRKFNAEPIVPVEQVVPVSLSLKTNKKQKIN